MEYVEELYQSPGYIGALAKNISDLINRVSIDHLLFKKDSVPETHRLAGRSSECRNLHLGCDGEIKKCPKCYLAQCKQTVGLLQQRLEWPQEKSTIAFQSELKKKGSLGPFVTDELAYLAKKGIKECWDRLPGFVADCLEYYLFLKWGEGLR